MDIILTFINEFFEILSFKILNRNLNYIVCILYRPPDSSINFFIDSFFDRLSDILHPDDKVILSGDFNINLFNPYKMLVINNFIDSMSSFSFFPVITKATKFNPNCPITRFSLIDQIWTNFKTGVHHLSAIMEYGLTDHFPVIYVFQQYSSLVNKTIHFRKIAAAAIENFYIKMQICMRVYV